MEYSRLRHPYTAVMKEGRIFYGGSQEWGAGVLKKYGCGVIAGTDILLYLSLHKDYCRGKEFKTEERNNGILEWEYYMETARRMRLKYFPLIPGLGMPGWLLALGIKRYFRRNGIPLKASFGVLGRNLENRIRAMLVHDIPVVLAVGPNFPIPLKKYKLAYYERQNHTYKEAGKTAAHFVVITGMEGEWMCISSWGKKYYVNLQEYRNYVRKHSSFLVSGILYIRRKKL